MGRRAETDRGEGGRQGTDWIQNSINDVSIWKWRFYYCKNLAEAVVNTDHGSWLMAPGEGRGIFTSFGTMSFQPCLGPQYLRQNLLHFDAASSSHVPVLRERTRRQTRHCGFMQIFRV